MPVYDYLCDHCGHAFSATGGFNDPQLSSCPQCGKAPRRLISATAIVFKGSGWYKTDSRSAPKEGGDAKPAVTGAESAATGGGAAAAGEARSGGPQSGDAKSGDAKSADPKSGEAKSAAAKSAAAKPAGSKGAAAAAASTPAPAAPTNGKPGSSS